MQSAGTVLTKVIIIADRKLEFIPHLLNHHSQHARKKEEGERKPPKPEKLWVIRLLTPGLPSETNFWTVFKSETRCKTFNKKTAFKSFLSRDARSSLVKFHRCDRAVFRFLTAGWTKHWTCQQSPESGDKNHWNSLLSLLSWDWNISGSMADTSSTPLMFFSLLINFKIWFSRHISYVGWWCRQAVRYPRSYAKAIRDAACSRSTDRRAVWKSFRFSLHFFLLFNKAFLSWTGSPSV